MDSIKMWSNTFYMSNMDVGSSLSWLWASTITSCHILPASQFYDWYSCTALSLGSFSQVRMHKIPSLYQLIYPSYWVHLYAIWHIFLLTSASVQHVQFYDVRHNETQSAATAFNLWGKRSLRNFAVLNTPILFFLENNSNLWVWDSGPVG